MPTIPQSPPEPKSCRSVDLHAWPARSPAPGNRPPTRRDRHPEKIKGAKDMPVFYSREAGGLAGLEELCAGLRLQTGGLKALLLRNNQITSDGMLHLAKALPVHRSLEVLDVGDNRLGNSGLQTLREPLMANRSLLHFGVACAHITCEAPPPHPPGNQRSRYRSKAMIRSWDLPLAWEGDGEVRCQTPPLARKRDTSVTTDYRLEIKHQPSIKPRRRRRKVHAEKTRGREN
ncbi:hypothetical protein CRUP_003888 [Coryphaenoides rupestris]|nr:hypothetical protein CRUP_003888 [Coryphaenoides rupestris]